MALPEYRMLASMWAVLELQPGRTMGSLEQSAVPGLPAVGQPHGILPFPTRLATTPASCFQPSLSMGMASWGPAGLRRGWVVPQPPSTHLSRARSSWTEDTRAQIFSESPSGHGIQETPCEELERRIEGKLKEFEVLAASGQQLVSEEHYLSVTVRMGKMGSGKPLAAPKILWGRSLEERARCGCRAPMSSMGPAPHPWGSSSQRGILASS